jgi:hypothetical protein
MPRLYLFNFTNNIQVTVLNKLAEDVNIMKKKLLSIWLVAVLLLVTQQVYAMPDWNFSTIPSDASISGNPGATIGWGYSISNPDASNWLVITGISANSFQFATPDDSIFNYPILAPLTSIVMPYDGVNGLYQITWDTLAPVGLVNIGSFTLTAEFYDGDPLTDGSFVDYATDQSVNYMAKVVGSDAAPVPEPSTMLLLSAGIGGLLFARRRMRG